MKRRDFCKALGLSAVGGLLLPAGSAAAAQPVGHAVPDGTYPLPFLSILSNLDITHDFYYSESLFDHPATEYDHQLAFVTLGMVMAAFTAAVSIPQYWVNGSVGAARQTLLPPMTAGLRGCPLLQLRHRHRQGRGIT